MAPKTKIRRSLLVILEIAGEKEMSQLVKEIENLKKNSFFYLTFKTTNRTPEWYQVMTFNRRSQVQFHLKN
jgi:hypothetical protein